MTTFGKTIAIGSVRSSKSSCIIPQTCAWWWGLKYGDCFTSNFLESDSYDDDSYDYSDNPDGDFEDDDDNYITPVCGELAAKEEVNKVDLDQR